MHPEPRFETIHAHARRQDDLRAAASRRRAREAAIAAAVGACGNRTDRRAWWWRVRDRLRLTTAPRRTPTVAPTLRKA